jgi:hypothetical protein
MAKTAFTKVELPTLSPSGEGAVSVKVYFNPDVENMGLEKYNLNLFDGVFHEEPVTCLENNGIQRYVTGLNPFAPEVKMIKDKDEREAKIKAINKAVADLEAELAANILDPESPTFWNDVKLLRPDNHEFWSKITIRCGNQTLYLNPKTNPHDLIRLYVIEAGGFSIVAPSYNAANKMAKRPKFYLDRSVETIANKTEYKKLRNEALSVLTDLFKKNVTKLRFIAKVVDANSALYKKSTPNDVVYDNMDTFINGQGVEKNIRKASEQFLSAADLDVETLKLKALIKDATYYKHLVIKSDGKIYHHASQTMLGANASECIEYLRHPGNDQLFGVMLDEIEKYWNN